MWKVYILKSISHNRYYTGMSENVNKRLKVHNLKKVKATKAFVPWKVIYEEGPFLNSELAREREKYFKSAAGKRYLQKNYFKPDYGFHASPL